MRAMEAGTNGVTKIDGKQTYGYVFDAQLKISRSCFPTTCTFASRV